MKTRKKYGDDDDENDAAFVSALARGLDILSSFRRGETSLGNRDFVQRTGLSKSTISRLTYTLNKMGYLSYNGTTSRYSLAPRVLSLGFSCLSGMSVLTLAKPKMQAFAEEYGAPVAVAGYGHLSMVYLECCRGNSAVTLAIDIGAHLKLATSAVGRAYIAALPEERQRQLLSALAEHEGVQWPDMERGIRSAISCYKKHGYCLSFRDWKPDVNAIAVPYIPGDGSAILAFNCGGSSHLLSEEKIIREVGPKLIELVREVRLITS